MDFGKAFSFVFDDPDWIKKVLIGIIPIANIGYGLEVARNVQNGVERPLPDWTGRIGEFFVLGFKYIVVTFVWSLPVSLLAFVLSCLVLVPAMGAASNAASEEAAAAAMMASLGGFACLMPVLLILALVLAPPMYIALGRLANTRDIGAALKFGEIITEARANWKPWLGVFGVTFLVSFVIGLLGNFTAGIASLLLGGYVQMVIGHAMGQVMRRFNTSTYGGAPTPLDVGPPTIKL